MKNRKARWLLARLFPETVGGLRVRISNHKNVRVSCDRMMLFCVSSKPRAAQNRWKNHGATIR
ncbi:TPA: hypothetical protein ACWZIO_003185 [Escherichia coli]